MENLIVTLTKEVAIPSKHIMDNLSRRAVADYINDKINNDPQWFGSFAEENVSNIYYRPVANGLHIGDILSREHTLE